MGPTIYYMQKDNIVDFNELSLFKSNTPNNQSFLPGQYKHTTNKKNKGSLYTFRFGM